MREEAYDTFYRLDFTHWFPCGRRQLLQTMIERFVSEPNRIADIGCGTGANFQMLQGFGSVVGVDFAEQAIAYCHQRQLNATAVAGLPHLPFRDETFDLVCALDVIEHIADDTAAVREMTRICRPGATLLLTVPAYQWLWSQHDDANQHQRRYTRAQLRKLFADLPMDILKLSHFNLLLSPPIVAVRLLGRIRDKLRPPATPKLDLAETPAPLNRLLQATLAAERFVIPSLNLPFGISILCAARKRSAH